MNTDVYVLYDSSIETEISLLKFNKILVLAGFEESKIKHISLIDYTTYLENNNFTFHSFVIAINQTYKEINQIYSKTLNLPIFDFFSKEFSNKKNNIILFGLLFSVNTIYEPACKKYSWIFIQKFFKEYQDFLQDHLEEDNSCDYLDFEVTPTPIESKKEIIVEDAIVETIEALPELIIELPKETVIETTSDLSYTFLLEFYNNNKQFFNYFNLIQDQLKSTNSSYDVQ